MTRDTELVALVAGQPGCLAGVDAGLNPGIYFLGALFQYSFTSMLIIGAGRDAAYVVDHIADRQAAGAPSEKAVELLA